MVRAAAATNHPSMFLLRINLKISGPHIWQADGELISTISLPAASRPPASDWASSRALSQSNLTVAASWQDGWRDSIPGLGRICSGATTYWC